MNNPPKEIDFSNNELDEIFNNNNFKLNKKFDRFDLWFEIHYWFRSYIKYPIKYFISSIKQLYFWFKTIWRQRDWDFSFMYKLMLFKIQRIRKRTERRQEFAGWENEVKYMKICESLLKRMIAEEYALEDAGAELYLKDRKLLYKILFERGDRWWD